MHLHTYKQQHGGTLDVVGLTKRYGSHIAILDAGFSARSGEVVARFSPDTKPSDPALISAIETELAST